VTTHAFINGRVLSGGQLRDDAVVVVAESRIERIGSADALPDDVDEVHDLDGRYLLPGFIDIQVNGGSGVLFNDRPDTEAIAAIAAAHHRYGTTGFLPTLISDELDVVRRAMAATDAAIADGIAGVIGIHVEGPFLNPARRGVHDERKLRHLTVAVAKEFEPIRNGRTLLTIAPEAAEPEAIRVLAQKGIVVSAGHSDATYEQTIAAVGQGLRGFTHLFNAMSQMRVREPGVVGAALDDDHTWAGIIADGHHVSPAAVRIACRCKGPERIMLVTDAMPPVGSALTEFSLLGRRVVVEDGICRGTDGTLAGTAIGMADAFRNIIGITGCTIADASRMASLSPATFLGIDSTTGSIEPGKRADLVVADADFKVSMTMIGGRLVWAG
jgi:N-acetylglucosamine-6-phosphate deacetylase